MKENTLRRISVERWSSMRQLEGFGIATVGLVNFPLGNFIFGVIIFLVGTAMLPSRG